MTDNPETEGETLVRKIRINEEAPLLDPNYPIEYSPTEELFFNSPEWQTQLGRTLLTSIDLKIDNDYTIPLEICLGVTPFIAFTGAFTPFDKEGYQVHQDTFEVNTRIAETREHVTKNVPSDNPLSLTIRSRDLDLEKAGLSEKDSISGCTKLMENVAALLKRLRVNVKIPQTPHDIEPEDPSFRPASSFESIPWVDLTFTPIRFDEFFPTDTGPLATRPKPGMSTPFLNKGLHLHFPRRKEDLAQTRIKFYLLPNPKKQFPAESDLEDE